MLQQGSDRDRLMSMSNRSNNGFKIAVLLWVFLLAPAAATFSGDHADALFILSLAAALLTGWGVDRYRARSRGRKVEP